MLALCFFLIHPQSAAQNQSNGLTNKADPPQAELTVPNNSQPYGPTPTTPGVDTRERTARTPREDIPLKAPHAADPAKIRVWLEAQKSSKATGSPLAPYAEQIAKSEYWSVILGICYIEQYHCTSAPGWNFWGLGPHKRFATAEESITAIDGFLQKAYSNGRTTVESLRGWYCASACSNWYPTVIKIKAEVEAL